MSAPGEPATLFSRVEEGGVIRRLTDGALGRPDLVQEWGAVGLVRMKVADAEAPEGRLLNHLVMLNVGDEAVLEASVGGGDWETFRLASRSLFVMPAAVPHALRGHGPGDHLFLEVAPALADALVGSGAAARLRPAIGVTDPFSEHVLLALAAEAGARARDGAGRVEKLASALLSRLAEPGAAEAPAPPPTVSLPSPKLRRVLEHVAANLDAPLGLQHLAELAGMDVFRFGRAFKQSTGISPHRYVLEARIERAKQLLGDRVLSITEVALATGFATPSHFSVTFRRLAGVPPRSWREGQR